MRVSALERSRYAVKSGLAELDSVRRELMAAPKSEDLNTLEDRIRQIEALDARQDATMQRLQATLSR
jgi:predicted ribonuclease toxin of YeeF-YezG toxin-antitoxin module